MSEEKSSGVHEDHGRSVKDRRAMIWRDESISQARPIFIFNIAPPELAGSVPLQATIPARHLGAKALYFGPDMDAKEFLDRYAPKVLIVTKLFNPAPLGLAQAAVDRGIKVIATVCDLHVNDVLGERTRLLCSLANAVVVPTASMAALMERHFGTRALVIEEPVELPRSDPRFEPGRPLRVLWIGHASNHDTLPIGIRELAGFESPISLMILSGAAPNMNALQAIVPGMPLSFLPWSPSLQMDMLRQCDVVFIPSTDNDSKAAKGQGRLVNSIQAGRVVVAHPLPQYQELADFCYLTRDYKQGLRDALAAPRNALARTEAGQRYIDARFAPEVVADKWAALICNPTQDPKAVVADSPPP